VGILDNLEAYLNFADRRIYVDGLERSGNVFLSGAISYAFKTNAISLRDHSIEIFKNRDKNAIFIVPLRDALPSLVSGRVYKDYAIANGLNRTNKGIYDPTDLVLKRYKEYTQYLLANEDLFIAPFDAFIEDHNAVIAVIGKTYNIEVLGHPTSEEIIKMIKVIEHPEIDNIYMSNFPRQAAPTKEKIKEELIFEHKEKIDAIQADIDQLYKRYYERAK